MSTVLLIIHLFVTLALIGVVLIQRSEGGGLGIGSSQGMGFVYVRARHCQPADADHGGARSDVHGIVADPGVTEPRHNRRQPLDTGYAGAGVDPVDQLPPVRSRLVRLLPVRHRPVNRVTPGQLPAAPSPPGRASGSLGADELISRQIAELMPRGLPSAQFGLVYRFPMTRFVFITGGVVSSLGKGIAAAALGALLQARWPCGQAAQTRPVSECRSRYHEPVSAWRGFRHR